MSNESSTAIVQKTLEEKQNQYKLVDLFRAVQLYREGRLDSVPTELLSLDIDEFRALLKSEQERSDALGEKTQFLKDYEQFLQDLRQLRKEQKEQIHDAMSGSKENETDTLRERYLRSVSYSDKLQQRALERMEFSGSYSGIQRLFTDEQIASAKDNETTFLELVQFGIKRSPESLFTNFEILERLLTRESLIATLELLVKIEPFRFVQRFNIFKHLFSEEKQKQLLLTAFGSESGDAARMLYLADQGIAELFTITEKRELLLSAAQTTYPKSFEKAKVKEYLQQGCINEDDVRSILLDFIRRDSDGMQKAFGFLEYFQTDEQKANLRTEVMKAYSPTSNNPDLWSLKYTQDVLSDDDRKTIILEFVAEKPDSLGFHFDILEEYLSYDEIQAWVKGALNRADWSLFQSRGLLKQLVEGNYVSTSDFQDFIKTCIQDKPEESIGMLDLILEHTPDLNPKEMVSDLILRVGVTRGLITVSEWLPIVCPDENEQKEFLRSYIMSENSFVFIRFFNSSYANQPLKTLFSEEEIRQMAFMQLELGAGDLFSDYDALNEIYKLLKTDEELKQFVVAASNLDPSGLIDKLDELAYLFTDDEISVIIETHSQNPRGKQTLVENIHKWAKLVDVDFVLSFLDRVENSSAVTILANLDKCLPYITEEKRQVFLKSLIRHNPAYAIYEISAIQRYLPDYTQEKMVQMALSDAEIIAFAPRILLGLYKDINNAKDETQRTTFLAQAAEIHMFISAIRAAGLDDSFRRIQALENLPKNREVELLSLFYCYALLIEKDSERYQPSEIGENIQEISENLFREVGMRIGVDDEFSTTEMTRFLTTMESPAPFLSYLLQYENSDAHKHLLTGMFISIAHGQYTEWKYGADDEQSFISFKEQKLLPQQLTLDQYRSWRVDEETTLQETLAADANSVSLEIKRTLLQNNNHLQIEALEENGLGPAKLVAEIQKELALVGKNIADARKRLAALRKMDSGDTAHTTQSEIQELEAEILELNQQRTTLIQNRSFLRLANLKPEEIAVGYLLEGAEMKTRDKPISVLIKELQSGANQEALIVLDQVATIFSSFRDQNLEKQNLKCVDSTSPKIMMEIGDRPVASCQNYAHGSHNDCLLGYTDPNTKILFLTNERGNPVARAIFRLLSTPDGEPVLHIERVYSTTASEGVSRVIYTRAVEKAARMGVRLLTSYDSPNLQDETGDMTALASFSTKKTSSVLVSEASRAPKVYVDSAGGERSWGRYVIGGNREIIPG